MKGENTQTLIGQCTAFFQRNNYTLNRINKYKLLWRHGIVPFMEAKGLETYNPSVGAMFIDTCHCHGTIRPQEREKIRSVQVLDDMLLTGSIRKRCCTPVRHRLDGELGREMEKLIQHLTSLRRSATTIGDYRLTAIHAFVSFLQYNIIEQSEEWQRILSIKAMRTERKALNYLSQEGIRLLLRQPDVTTMQGRRRLAILSLMYDTGARVQEIADLTVEFVRIESEPYTIRLFGKGRKARVVPMEKEQVDHLRQYMEENRLNSSDMFGTPLFFNNRHEKLTREGVAYILKIYADMARKVNPSLIQDRLSCHSIRHSKAMHLLQAGVNLVYIRDILGHVSIQTTDLYARADSKAKREALEKAYADLNPGVKSDCAWERDKNLLEWLKSLNH